MNFYEAMQKAVLDEDGVGQAPEEFICDIPDHHCSDSVKEFQRRAMVSLPIVIYLRKAKRYSHN